MTLRTGISRLAVGALLGLAAMLSLAGAASAGETPHGWHVHCGDDRKPVGYGWFDSKGFNVDCRTVRRVANHYTFENLGDRRFNGWRCDDDPVGIEVSRVDCKRRRSGHEHVRFKFGA